MEEGAKRRLVGAAVMVLLLVIFLPMVLEEETKNPVSDGELEIPPRPEFDQGYEASVSDGPDESLLSAFPEQTDSVPGEPPPQELAAPPIFDAPASEEFTPPSSIDEAPPIMVREELPLPESQPAPTAIPAPESQPTGKAASTSASKPPPAPKAATAPAPKPAPAQEPRKAPVAVAGISAWVVQVASVRDLNSAMRLQQDLRRRGFPAFVEQADVKQQLWHRIRVGPEADRNRIESMAASIASQTGLNVQVQRYP